MEAEFAAEVAKWTNFFNAVAGISATLVGLLFVGVALNPSIMTDEGPAGLRAWIGQTFHSFITLLVLALVVIIPEPSPTSLGISLVITAGQGLYGIARNVRAASADPDPDWHGRHGLLRFGSSIVAYVMGIVAGIGVWRGDTDMLGWLVAVVMFLIIGSAINSWELLKMLGDRHKMEQAGLVTPVSDSFEDASS